MPPPLRILLIDDEAPARQRLRDLLTDLAPQLPTVVVGEADDGRTALDLINDGLHADVALVDLRMPRLDGIGFAQYVATTSAPPAIIFVTAFDDRAVQAFELSATDYLLKPVRAERLLTALRKLPLPSDAKSVPSARRCLRSTERGRLRLIPFDEVIYLRSENKYVLARTAQGEFLVEDSLSQLEEEFGPHLIRIHRACLAMRSAIAGACQDETNEGHWLLILHGADERLPISRRQWPAVRELLDRISDRNDERKK